MSYTTPQLDAAEAVATLLSGREIAGWRIVARRSLLPKYEHEELRDLKVDCVPATPFTRARINRGAVSQECPVNIGVQLLCDAGNDELIARLKFLTSEIAELAEGGVSGFHGPTDEVEVDEVAEMLENEGRYMAIVSVMLLAMTEVGA